MLFFAMLVLCGARIAAQPPPTCPEFVQAALENIAYNCGVLGRNTACYGYDRVDTTFATQVEIGYFSQPTDRAALDELRTIRTSPLDAVQQQWGIAVMNVQANVPGTLPGQAVTFLMLGDATVENRVTAEDAFMLDDTVAVTVPADAVLRSAPMSNSNITALIPAETPLEADAIDESGDWLRASDGEFFGWLRRDEIAEPGAVEALPVFTEASRSPMQAFYFSTGVGEPECNQAPSVVTVQSPEQFQVELEINGEAVRIGSIIDLTTLADDQIAFTVREGTLEAVRTGQVARTGETITATIDEDGTITDWGEVRPATAAEASIGQAAQEALANLLPDVEEPIIAAEEDTATVRTSDAGEVIHVVQRGETLFSIGTLYDASLPAIVDRNNLSDEGIVYVGQELVIPNPGSGFIGLPNLTPEPPRISTSVDCTAFRGTSPSGGLAYGENTFFWDAAPGATAYRLIVTNLEEGRTVIRETQATNVTAVLDQQSIGGGFEFVWQVQALVDGEVACATPGYPMLRGSAGEVGADDPVTALTASWGCAVSAGAIVINFNGALAGDTVTATFTAGPVTVTRTATGPSGTITYTSGAATVSNGQLTTSSGGLVNLSPASLTC